MARKRQRRPGGGGAAASLAYRQHEHDSTADSTPQLELPLSWPPRAEPDRDDELDDFAEALADLAALAEERRP